MKSVIESIKNHFIFPYLGYIILIVLPCWVECAVGAQREPRIKAPERNTSHISILLTKEKDLSIQVQQGVLKQQICAVTHTQKNNKKKTRQDKDRYRKSRRKRKRAPKAKKKRRDSGFRTRHLNNSNSN